MPTTLIPEDEKQEEKNIGQQHTDQIFNTLSATEQRGTVATDGLEKEPDNEQSSGSNASPNYIKDVQNSEQSPPWRTNLNNNNNKSEKVFSVENLKVVVKKRGPLFTILSILGIGGFGATVLFSPSILIVNAKEVFAGKFNDQLTTLNIRSHRALVKKIGKDVTKGICTPVTIACKYQTMSARQIEKLNKAGIEVLDKDGNKLTSRGRPSTIKIGEELFDAEELTSRLTKDFDLVAKFNKAYNPKIAAFSDSIAKNVNQRLKVTRKNNFEGVTTKEEASKKLRSNVAGEGVDLEGSAKLTLNEDGSYTDGETGATISKEVAEKRLADLAVADAEIAAKEVLKDSGKVVAKTAVKGTLTVTALGLGAVDSSCTGYRSIRAIGFASKYIGMLQLLRYAYSFMNTADAIKAGSATPEQSTYFANIITSTNSEGKSIGDSYGYKYAAYGEAPTKPVVSETSTANEALLADEVNRYTNGQIISGNILASIVSAVGAQNGTTRAADDICKFEKSGWGQSILFGTAIVGGVVAFFTGGLSLGWGTVAQVGASVAIGIAMGLLTPKLIDMVSSTLVTGDENGNEAGNAIASGMGAYNAQVSQGRGLAALTKEDAVAYSALTDETVALYASADRVDANPLDATNSNTFLGSFVSKLIPFVYSGKAASFVSPLLGSFSAASHSLLSVFTSKATSNDEFSVCQDPEYAELNLATDPFCNVRYGLSTAALNKDPEDVLSFMIKNGHVDEISGEPKSDEFKGYIKNCVERTNSIGGYSDDNSDTGEGCIEGGKDSDRNTMFRLYLIDKSIITEMEGESSSSTGGSE